MASLTGEEEQKGEEQAAGDALALLPSSLRNAPAQASPTSSLADGAGHSSAASNRALSAACQRKGPGAEGEAGGGWGDGGAAAAASASAAAAAAPSLHAASRRALSPRETRLASSGRI